MASQVGMIKGEDKFRVVSLPAPALNESDGDSDNELGVRKKKKKKKVKIGTQPSPPTLNNEGVMASVRQSHPSPIFSSNLSPSSPLVDDFFEDFSNGGLYFFFFFFFFFFFYLFFLNLF